MVHCHVTCYMLIIMFRMAATEYSPVLSWDVCSPSRIVVTLTGGIDGGIIYIRGYGSACKQDTLSVETRHEFAFDACGIEKAETYFTIIVQKNPLYQTGSDLQESLLCIYDLSDISVGNGLNVGNKNDDAGVNKTVKPTATMKLYKDGVDIGGSDVKLTDLVTMTIQVDDEFIEDFDIKAKSCRANFIDITKDFCAADTDLFPNFVHVTQGVVTSTFGAFRTTDLGSGSVEMVFTCTVQVCRGLCVEEVCGDETGWGRRKKREVKEDVAFEDLNVGTSMSVGTDIDLTPIDKDNDDSVCIAHLAFILGLIVILLVLVSSLSLAVIATGKLLKRTEQLRKLSNIHEVDGKEDNLKLGMERATTLPNTEPPKVGISQRAVSNTGNTLSNKRSDVKKSQVDVDKLRDEKTNSNETSEATSNKAERNLKASSKVSHNELLTWTDLAHLKKCRNVLKIMELNNCKNVLTKQQSMQ
ncbi:uncharacterized protein LOC132755223 [Ruditapes philippinarum]|uniref:uncharacterized protein LOC132755223 n=1 Tax=Ruditapes philippinarum TaxID=129788 RepID=UPI00295B0DAD|nr:uncharacterized protein LOC132755223 [Ruditapes philippinarum]